jgi:excisionase family DNA binding protein
VSPMPDVWDVSRGTSATVSDTPGKIDLSDWMTKQQAADVIGVSTKAIERFAKAGRLEQRSRPQAHGPNVAVYFPDDVAALARERQPAATPFVVPAVPDPPRSNARPAGSAALTVSPPSTAGDDPVRALFAAAMRAVLSQTSETSAMSATLYVTVKEAAGILGLPQADVRRLIRDGDLPHRLTGRGGIRIRRRDLEQL